MVHKTGRIPGPPYPGYETWEERTWKERRKAIDRWVSAHPSTVDILSDLFFQGRRFKAHRTVQKMCEKGELPCIGTVKLGDGRPASQYCGYPVKEDLRFHEHKLSELAACYPGAEWTRRPDLQRPPFEDARMRLGGDEYAVELHTGSMRGAKARERFDAYRDSTCPVLWVALDQTGADYLLDLAPENHFVAALEDARQEPHGLIWRHRVIDGAITLVKKAALEA